VPSPLPVVEVIRDTFQFVWDKRARMLRALLIPAVLMLVAEQAFTFANDDPLKWAQVFIITAIYVLFAITCHRLALMGDQGVPDYGLRTWTQREWRYLGWAIVLITIGVFFFFVINSLVVSIVTRLIKAGVKIETIQPFESFVLLACTPILYLFSRFSVLYPAISLDQSVSAASAWRLTAHNGWRMAMVVCLLPWVLSFLLSYLLRENATHVETIIHKLLGLILLAVGIVALSFSYKYLTKQVTPPAAECPLLAESD